MPIVHASGMPKIPVAGSTGRLVFVTMVRLLTRVFNLQSLSVIRLWQRPENLERTLSTPCALQNPLYTPTFHFSHETPRCCSLPPRRQRWISRLTMQTLGFVPTHGRVVATGRRSSFTAHTSAHLYGRPLTCKIGGIRRNIIRPRSEQ